MYITYPIYPYLHTTYILYIQVALLALLASAIAPHSLTLVVWCLVTLMNSHLCELIVVPFPTQIFQLEILSTEPLSCLLDLDSIMLCELLQFLERVEGTIPSLLPSCSVHAAVA